MVKKANPRRYAQAVFEIALEQKELDRWQSDLQQLAEAVGVEAFLDVLENPRITIEAKEKFIRGSLSGISPLSVNLALLLVSKSGIKTVAEIAAEYKKMLDAQRGVETAQVTTAIRLDDSDKEKLKAELGVLTGAKIELKTEVDAAILGGVIARVGGKLLDGSTRSKLAALKRELVGRG